VAGEILSRLPVKDISIGDVPLESVIEAIYRAPHTA